MNPHNSTLTKNNKGEKKLNELNCDIQYKDN